MVMALMSLILHMRKYYQLIIIVTQLDRHVIMENILTFSRI